MTDEIGFDEVPETETPAVSGVTHDGDWTQNGPPVELDPIGSAQAVPDATSDTTEPTGSAPGPPTEMPPN
jgi:hypothetical protein